MVRPEALGRGRLLLLGMMLAVCVVGRGAYALHLAGAHPELTTEGDTKSYLEPARALAEHGRFNHGPDDDEPEFLRTPGYPLFVAVVYKVGGESDRAVLLAQVLASALTVVLVFLLGARMWSVDVGLLAALLAVVDPLQSYTSGTLMSECLSTLTLVVIAGALWRVFSAARPSWPWSSALGLAIAVATMVRPVTYYFPLVVLAMFAVWFARRADLRRAVVVATAAFLVPLVVVLGGWQLRNQREAGSWRLSGIEAKNLYLFRAAGVVADREGISFEEAQHRLRAEFGSRPDGESEGSYYGRMHERGVELLAEDPLRTAKVMLDGLFSELGSVRLKTFEYFQRGEPSFRAELTAFSLLLACYALAVWGFAAVWRARRELLAHVAVVSLPFYVLALSAGPEAFGGRGERFRAPVMPILVLYTAFGAHTIWTAARARRAQVTRNGRVASHSSSTTAASRSPASTS
jgi:4-amino-4-deoxy-L-arabinose transferase-like glycosyltransferase